MKFVLIALATPFAMLLALVHASEHRADRTGLIAVSTEHPAIVVLDKPQPGSRIGIFSRTPHRMLTARYGN